MGMKALGSVDPNTRKESGKEEVREKRRKKEGRREGGKKEGWREGLVSVYSLDFCFVLK